MKYYIKLSIILATLFSASCANRMITNKLGDLDSKNKTIQLTNNVKTPNADYFTFGEAMSSILLSPIITTITSKRGIVDISHAENPEIYLKEELAKILSQKYNLKIISPSKEILEARGSFDTNDILEQYKEGDLVLDMYSSTTGGYYPGRIYDFRTYYNVTANLINRKTKESVYKSICNYNGTEGNDFTLRMIANDKEVIRSIFEKAKAYCLYKFAAEINNNINENQQTTTLPQK